MSRSLELVSSFPNLERKETSRVELISTNGAVVGAFALTRATMAVVILGTLFARGAESEQPVLFILQTVGAATAVVALLMSVNTLIRQLQRRPTYLSLIHI